MSKLCIYHGNCADGFTAAWAVWKKHPDTEFHAGVYQQEPPDCTGRDVVMVDFSYKRPVLIEIAAQAKSVLILDHHKSAEADLVDLPKNVTAIFDMNRSGAMMAWEHFHPDKKPSFLVKHVQDRDLWRFEMEQTRAFQANLFSMEYTFENWEMVNALCADDYKYWSFVQAGEAIERKHFKDIKELIKVAGTRSTIAGFDVPTLNAPYFFSSDAGRIMGKGEPFAACYWDTPEGRVFSLRSEEGGQDVSEIAAIFGGGGHKHAAGFKLAGDELHRLEIGEVMGKEQTMMLRYSNEHPTQIGYYWFKPDDEYKRPLILEVLYGNSKRNTFVAWNGHCYIETDRFKGVWSNRIPQPSA